jgi:hypothetical protein
MDTGWFESHGVAAAFLWSSSICGLPTIAIKDGVSAYSSLHRIVGWLLLSCGETSSCVEDGKAALEMVSLSIRASEPRFQFVALQMHSNLEPSVVLQELLHMRKGISAPFPRCSTRFETARQGMCCTDYVGHVLMVMLVKTSDSDHQRIDSAAQCLHLKWESLICVNWWDQVEQIDISLLVIVVHTQQTIICGSTMGIMELTEVHNQDTCSGSTPIPINLEVILRSIMASTTTIHEQHFRYCFSCTCSLLSLDRHAEDVVSMLFGLCHRRWTTTPPLLILRFNSRDTLSLSSVKVIQDLQLNSIPHVHNPDRPLGEPSAGHQLDRTSIEAFEDYRCGNFEFELSTDERTPYGSICDLQHLLREFRSPSCSVVQLGTYLSCSFLESHVMMYHDP